MQKILKIPQPEPELQHKLSKALGISPILAQVLINRGIKSVRTAERFLEPRLADLLSPWKLKDMQPAVERIKQAARHKEKTLIFGDYDVDGVTSVALLKTHFERLGIPTMHYIPNRIKEGYGLNAGIVDIAKSNGVKLIVTVDCGINSFSEIEKLKSAGIEVIVTDHHEPQERIPSACAVINPKRHDCSYEYKYLSGVGVAYKFCQALTNSDLEQDLDLVTLGTVADSVALNGENRIIVKEGLKRIPAACRLGIQALIEAAGVKQKSLGTSAVTYILGPRINASGRIDTAENALRLLLSQSPSEAQDLAKILNSHNRKRQKIESEIFKQAKNLIDKEVNFKEHHVIVVSGEDWHPGVLGIVASRLVDKFYRPTILISEPSSGLSACRGSARSIEDFSIFEALVHCRKYLKDFGGHKCAAGLAIAKEDIQDFRRDINQFARQIFLKQLLLPSIEADMQISLSDLSEDLIYQLKKLEPFGSANPEPIFYVRNLTLRKQSLRVLSRDTLKFWVTDSRLTYPVIGFGLGWLKQKLLQADSFDLVFHPEIDQWQDNQGLLLEAKEIIFR